MCWGELQPGLQGGFVSVEHQMQTLCCDSQRDWETTTPRLDVELWEEEWDHRDGDGTVTSLMASAVAK